MSEEIKEKFMQFQYLQKHIEKVQEHVQLLNQQNEHITETLEALDGIKDAEVGSEIFAPMANGIFVKGTLTDNKKLIVNVGASTVVEKTVDEVITLLRKQQEEMSHKIIEAEAFMQKMHEQAYHIYQEVEKEQ
jgi:prefoldin alpha subunit